MPRLTKAHKELTDIVFEILWGDDPDAADNLITEIIAHLSHKDAKEFADLWRSEREDQETEPD